MSRAETRLAVKVLIIRLFFQGPIPGGPNVKSASAPYVVQTDVILTHECGLGDRPGQVRTGRSGVRWMPSGKPLHYS